MSIVQTLDIFCDTPGCGSWIGGTTGPVDRYGLRDARARARRFGWVVKRTSGGGRGSTWTDVCPECARGETASDRMVIPRPGSS